MLDGDGKGSDIDALVMRFYHPQAHKCYQPEAKTVMEGTEML